MAAMFGSAIAAVSGAGLERCRSIDETHGLGDTVFCTTLADVKNDRSRRFEVYAANRLVWIDSCEQRAFVTGVEHGLIDRNDPGWDQPYEPSCERANASVQHRIPQ